jgi:outer membrane protein assembly factor BamC
MIRTMSMRGQRPLLFALCSPLVLSLGGCGYLFGDDGVFRDRSGDYRQAEAPPRIRLPQGLESESIAEIYAVPEVTAEPTLGTEDRVPRPDPLVAASADQLVRIQRLGEDSWVLVAIAPGQLWPQLRSFMSAANITIARMDARAGIIESNYLELQGIERPARFRFRVERGVQRGNSELHVLQQYQGTDAAWPARSDDLELEGEMLRGIAQYIANSADTAPVSMMAEQSISAQARVAVREDADGRPYIELELPFDRAWASLARSLERSGFEITDRNRSTGNYYVTYVGETDEDKGGWFSWLGGDEDHPAVGIPMLVTLEERTPALMHIDLRPEQDDSPLRERDREALLVLIKGNID